MSASLQYKMPGPFIIGISGGSSSGKTSVCQAIFSYLGEENCSVIPISSSSGQKLNSSEPNPSNFNLPELALALESLKTHPSSSQKLETDYFKGLILPTKIILLEGSTIFIDKQIRDLCDMKIFVQTDDDERLARKLLNNSNEKHPNPMKAIHEYRKFDKPEYENFVGPTLKYADVIIPRGSQNFPAMEILKENLSAKIKE